MMEGGGIECDGVGSVADEDLLLDLCEHRPIMPPDIPREAEDLTTKGSYNETCVATTIIKKRWLH